MITGDMTEFDLHIAGRALGIDASGIRKVFDLGQRRRLTAAPGQFIDLSIGQPDYDVPDAVKGRAIEAIESGFNGYTVTQGIGELCDALKVKIENDLDWRPESVMVTSGVSGGLVLSLLATVESGDEVTDLKWRQYFTCGREFSLNTDQCDGIIFSCVFSGNVV